MYKISVLISGSGSTLDNLAYHCFNSDDGMLYGFVEIVKVIADRDCKGLEIADYWDIPKEIIKLEDYEDNSKWSEALFNVNVDLHVMGGFLSRVVVTENLKDKIVNIHPSLLPAYGGEGMYGIKVHEAVIAAGESVTGCTVHTVDNQIDQGMILGQIKQAVLESDTAKSLQHAVQAMEHNLYPRTILNYLMYLSKQKKNVASEA